MYVYVKYEQLLVWHLSLTCHQDYGREYLILGFYNDIWWHQIVVEL